MRYAVYEIKSMCRAVLVYTCESQTQALVGLFNPLNDLRLDRIAIDLTTGEVIG